MALLEALDEHLKAAMRERDTERLDTIRAIKTALKNKQIDKKGELDEKEMIQVISTLAKQRKESIEAFRQGNREDLAAREERQLEILSQYLPEQLSEEELDRLVDEAVEKLGATGPADIGRVMKTLMADLSGRADGKLINMKVKQKLTGVN